MNAQSLWRRAAPALVGWLLVAAVLGGLPVTAAPALKVRLIEPPLTALEFGKNTVLRLELENSSDEFVVVVGLTPMSNPAEAGIALSGPVYGSVGKDGDDRFVYDPWSQSMSGLPFHSGLLAPSQRLYLGIGFVPIASSETFEVRFHSLGKVCDRFRVYIPEASPAEPPKAGAANLFPNLRLPDPPPTEPQITILDPTQFYVPFNSDGWRRLSATQTNAGQQGPRCLPRSVLIPGLQEEPQRQSFTLLMSYAGQPFLREQACHTAQRITGDNTLTNLAYCRTLGGYVVAERDGQWVLSNPGQTNRVSWLPPFPFPLLKDLDAGQPTRVWVGSKQEGMSPGGKAAPWQLWDRYPVRYGDGRYTRGEFVTLSAAEMPEFLRLLRARRGGLGVHHYFFGETYYTLVMAPRGSDTPQAPR